MWNFFSLLLEAGNRFDGIYLASITNDDFSSSATLIG